MQKKKRKGKHIKMEASTLALSASPMVHRWRFITFFGALYFAKSDLRALPTFYSNDLTLLEFTMRRKHGIHMELA